MPWLAFIFLSLCLTVTIIAIACFLTIFAQRPRAVRDDDGHWRSPRGHF